MAEWSFSILENTDPLTQPSFALSNRLARAAWGIVYVLLFRPSPRPFHGWRALLLRCFGARLGRGCHIYPAVSIWAPWNLVLGDYACLADGVKCYSVAPIEVGDRAVVSQATFLCTASHDHEDPTFRLVARPIRIGARAWVCAEVFVCPGVVIGEGAVIGARSVVTRDVPAWTVAAGNPCRSLKPRKLRDPL